MRRGALMLLGASIVASCHEYRTDPSRVEALPPPPPPARATSAAPEYLVSEDSASTQGLAPTPDSPDGGKLAGGLRIGADGSVSSEVATPPLVGGARVPKRFGGGFLFWSASALYASKTFTGHLEPALALPTRVSRVSFGVAQAFLHFAGGGRWALSAPGFQKSTIPAPGLIDQVSAEDGRAVMLLAPDRVLTRARGSTTWKDTKGRGHLLVDLASSEDGIWFGLGGGRALRLEADGTFTELSALPQGLRSAKKKSTDPRWPTNISDTPRQSAIRGGVPLDERNALVVVNGAFAHIDVVSGELGELTPAVVPSPQGCELVPFGSDVLAACRSATGGAVVVSGASGKAPKIDKVFQASGTFFAGAQGTLVFGGPCSESRTDSRAVVCARQHDGSWRELGQPALSTDAGAGPDGGARQPIAVSRWVPTSNGGALGLVGGGEGGIYDAATDQLTRFSNKEYLHESQLFYVPSSVVADDLIVAEDGSIQGYVGSGSVRLRRDGRLERAPFTFSPMRSAGAFALGRDSSDRLWQSTTWGREWAEVAQPPGGEVTSLNVLSCSRVGCDLGSWYRLGYRKSAPKSARFDPAPPGPVPKASEPPRLSCTSSGAPKTRWATRARSPEGQLQEEFELGARKVRVRTEGELVPITFSYESGPAGTVRAATLSESALGNVDQPSWSALLAKPRTLRFYETFGESRLVESRFSWADWARVRRPGSELPQPLNATERTALLVLSPRTGSSDGMILFDDDGALLWARAGAPARAFSLGPESAELVPLAAVARDKDELVVLAATGNCGSRVISVTPTGPRVLFEIPEQPIQQACSPNPDTLGLASDGAVAVLRMPSREPATADDPALALSANAAPVALAPWSSLKTDGCPSESAYRALVAPTSAWLDLEMPGVESDGASAFMIVRWGAQHACLEAAEVSASEMGLGEQSLPTTVMARFGAKPDAARRGFALGAESVQALGCHLGSP